MVLSVNSLALATTVGLVAISSAVLFAPGRTVQPAPSVNVAPGRKSLEFQVGRVQVRWLPKDGAAPATTAASGQPPQDGINFLTRAAIVVAATTLVILGITFLQSVFEEHASELAVLEERVAEFKEVEDALAAEVTSLKASILEGEGKLRTHVRRAPRRAHAAASQPRVPRQHPYPSRGRHAPSCARRARTPSSARAFRAHLSGLAERLRAAIPSGRADTGGGARQDSEQAGGARPAPAAQERLRDVEARRGGIGSEARAVAAEPAPQGEQTRRRRDAAHTGAEGRCGGEAARGGAGLSDGAARGRVGPCGVGPRGVGLRGVGPRGAAREECAPAAPAGPRAEL